jgi:hypothetical protein
MSRQRRRPSRGRTSRGLALKVTVLIVGEGRETEANYFNGLKRLDEVSARFTITVKRGRGSNPESVVQEAIGHKQVAERRSEDYDEVWCVLDVEGPDKRESLGKARTLANQNGIRLCLSNPSFEVWFLAHFVRTRRSFRDGAAVIVELNRHWPRVSAAAYNKSDEQVFERLEGLLEEGVRQAKAVRENDHHEADTADCNSSTEVYRLVEHLLGRS